MLKPAAVHEAGHCVVGREVWGEWPEEVTVTLGIQLPFGGTHANRGTPTTPQEATLHARFLEAGRAAVAEGVSRNMLPASTDPLHGYSGPFGSNSDEDLLRRLVALFDDTVTVGADAAAASVVASRWEQVIRLSEALERCGSLTREQMQQALG